MDVQPHVNVELNVLFAYEGSLDLLQPSVQNERCRTTQDAMYGDERSAQVLRPVL